MKKRKILIIGGGIGGLTAGIALRQGGFEVEIFERAAELREAGAGIALSPNAMRALNYLGLVNQVTKCGTAVEALVSYNSNGRLIGKVSTTGMDMPTVCLHRADLQKALLSQLPPECVHLGEEFVRFEQSRDEVAAHFTSGHAASGEALIGADGLRSRARAELMGVGELVYRGYQCWRGVCGERVRNELTESFGLGVRVGIVPIGSRGTAWWCTANEAEAVRESPEESKAKLLGFVGDWHDPIPGVIRGTDSSAIIKTAMYDRRPAKGWSKGRCTLLGDAAHPTTPNMGQGGCMAIEDAVVLTRCLSRYQEVERAFQEYERLRYPRTRAVTNLSRYYGALGQWKSPMGAWIREKLVRLGSGEGGAKGYRRFVSYDAGKEG